MTPTMPCKLRPVRPTSGGSYLNTNFPAGASSIAPGPADREDECMSASLPSSLSLSVVETSLPEGSLNVYRASRPRRVRSWWRKALGL